MSYTTELRRSQQHSLLDNEYNENDDIELHDLTEKVIQKVDDAESKENAASNYKYGVLFLCLSCVSYCCSSLILKVIYGMNKDTTPVEVAAVRNAIAIPLFLFVSLRFKQSLFQFNGVLPLLLCAALGSIGSGFCSMWALKYISATKAQLISNCYPVLGMTFAFIYLKETISSFDKFSVGLTMIGAFLIVQNDTKGASDLPHPEIGYTFSILQCIIFAGVSVLIRTVNQRVSFILFPFYFALMHIPVCLLFHFLAPGMLDFHKFTLNQIGVMFIYACFNLSGQLCMSTAYKYALASELAPLWNLGIILNFTCEFLVMGYNFSLTDFCGTFVMLLAFLAPILLRMATKSA